MLADAPSRLLGHARPRIAPPPPLRASAAGFRRLAADLGIDLFPWQGFAARFITALDDRDRWLYPEVGIVVGRQNGKTELLIPLIVSRLRAGQKIMHTAQNRDLPREVFAKVADIMAAEPGLFPLRNGRSLRPRFANGQEEIKTANGGSYRIVAPNRGGARGPSNDLVIIDELREMDTFDFIGAAKPTLTASRSPQMLYLSNAGTDDSLVLNGLRERAGKDPRLAYLEWSARPDRAADDRIGWREANPAIGHLPALLDFIEGDYASAALEGTLALFEVEHLCRWVVTMRERLVDDFAWRRCEGELDAPHRPYMAVSMDPSGRRASAALAWRQADGRIALRLLYDVTGDPIDTDALGADLRETARQYGARKVGVDPLTDGELAKFFRTAEPLTGRVFANASARFGLLVNGGKLAWSDGAAITDDLIWTAKKQHDVSGSFQAVRANDDRPITAALAAIRATWLASGPALRAATVW